MTVTKIILVTVLPFFMLSAHTTMVQINVINCVVINHVNLFINVKQKFTSSSLTSSPEMKQ